MIALVIAILLTLSVSALCSTLEAFVLSITTSEIEAVKKRHLTAGTLLERFKGTIEETSTAILTLNTIANTAGASVVGILAVGVIPEDAFLGPYLIPIIMTAGILVFSEIIPKNIGVSYRRKIPVPLTYGILFVRTGMKPVSLIMRRVLTAIVMKEAPTEEEQEEEIRLLAERSVKAGALDENERALIANALSLDDIKVESIMTPRTVVTFIEAEMTVDEVFAEYRSIPFARMPVYVDTIDDIEGIVRRRDILQAYSEDRGHLKIRELMRETVFVPETASALQALQLFLKKHQQIAVVVDEYGSTAGVVSMEDIIEHLIGSEIYEHSDVAVDMRKLARKRAEKMPPVTPALPEVTEPAPAPDPAARR